jgi:hypothetical protein
MFTEAGARFSAQPTTWSRLLMACAKLLLPPNVPKSIIDQLIARACGARGCGNHERQNDQHSK